MLMEDDDENQCSSGEGFDIEEVESDTLIESLDEIVGDEKDYLEEICVKKELFKGNVFEELDLVKGVEDGYRGTGELTSNNSKSHGEFFPMLELSSDAEMFSAK